MEKIGPELEEVVDDLKEYVNTSIDLYKLQAAEKGSEIAANAIINIVTAVFILIFLQFVSIAAALGLGVVFGEAYLGFLAVAGFYGLIGLIIMATKEKWLKTNLVNNIIKSLYGPKNEN